MWSDKKTNKNVTSPKKFFSCQLLSSLHPSPLVLMAEVLLDAFFPHFKNKKQNSPFKLLLLLLLLKGSCMYAVPYFSEPA
jgi:hypothetical protein